MPFEKIVVVVFFVPVVFFVRLVPEPRRAAGTAIGRADGGDRGATKDTKGTKRDHNGQRVGPRVSRTGFAFSRNDVVVLFVPLVFFVVPAPEP